MLTFQTWDSSSFIDLLALESIFSIHLCHPTQDQVHSKQTIGDTAAEY